MKTICYTASIQHTDDAPPEAIEHAKETLRRTVLDDNDVKREELRVYTRTRAVVERYLAHCDYQLAHGDAKLTAVGVIFANEYRKQMIIERGVCLSLLKEMSLTIMP